MKENLIITIEREFGSGGRFIGQRLANALNIPFYDDAIIERAAMKSGFDKEFIGEQEQKINNSLLFNIATNGYYTGGSLHDQIFIAERDVITEIAPGAASTRAPTPNTPSMISAASEATQNPTIGAIRTSPRIDRWRT